MEGGAGWYHSDPANSVPIAMTMEMSASAIPQNCANCGERLAGHFCHACGQRAHVHKSLLHLGEEFLHGILHFDTKGWRTLPRLIARPGELTRMYIDGHRTRYVSPLALFLFMVFCMFFTASLTNSGGPDVDVRTSPIAVAAVREDFEKRVAETRAEVAAAQAALAAVQTKGGNAAPARERLDSAREDQTSAEQQLSVFKRTAVIRGGTGMEMGDIVTGWPALDTAVKHAAKNPELILYKLKSTGAKFSFLLVPISLPFLWLLFFWRRGVTMYDHAVFALYSLSFMALLFMAVFVLNAVGLASVSALLVMAAVPAHMFLQLRGTYRLSTGEALWRTVALVLISAIVLLIYLSLILILSMR